MMDIEADVGPDDTETIARETADRLKQQEKTAPNGTRQGVAAFLRHEAEALEDWLDPTGARVLRLAADVLDKYETKQRA